MKLHVAVGAKMSREAWETVTLKLLDLVGGGLDRVTVEHVRRFIDRGVRAWPDLEQRATRDNPDVDAPIAPLE